MYDKYFIEVNGELKEISIIREFFVSNNQAMETRFLVDDEDGNVFSIYPTQIIKRKKGDLGPLVNPVGRYRIGLPDEKEEMPVVVGDENFAGREDKEFSLIYDYKEQLYYVGNIGIGIVDWTPQKKDASMLTHDSAKIALTMLESICGKSFLRIIKVDKDRNEIE